MTFLEKLEDTVKHHPHFLTHKLADQRTRKSLGRGSSAFCTTLGR